MANNLKDHLKEVADAIRAKKGTSDLINPQDFATEIEGISGGGGGELEGDYFLAKANEYYWKPNLPMAEKMTYDMPEHRVYTSFCTIFSQVGAVFEGVRFNGSSVGYKDVNFFLQTHYNAVNGDSTIYNPIIAIRESDIDNPNFGKYRSLVELYKTLGEMEGTPMTDEEVVAQIEGMGLTRITKEEFEALITA
jgi:hypothetical protein